MRRDGWCAIAGCVLVTFALATIWAARATVPRHLYVSELGAEGAPTEHWFMGALLAIVVGGALIAWAGRSVRAGVRWLAAWTPSVSLWVACALFLFASQVTCTAGCPLPYGPSFNWQDFWHTLAAVIAFVATCFAMLQAAFARRHRLIAILSAASCILVGGIAATGGLLALFRFQTILGSWLELVATTIGIVWVVVYGAALARAALARRDERAPSSQSALIAST